MFTAIALLLGFLALCVALWPLTRSLPQVEGESAEVAFFRKQLSELDARRRGLEATDPVLEEERTEVARRLLRAARGEAASSTGQRLGRRGLFATAAVVSIVFFASAFGLYAQFGSPDMPDVPLALQKQQDLKELPVEALVARAEERLQKNPNDLAGWQVLEPVYARLQRFQDQERALLQIVRLDGETADRLAQLARLAALNNGNVVTKRANDLLERALELDPENEAAIFFSALAREQEGRNQEAVALLKRLLAKAEPGSQMEPVLRDRIATLGGDATPAPAPEAEAAIRSLPQDEQRNAIRGMVERLAARLDAGEAGNEGWPRLVNAYLVLEELDKAQAALVRARSAVTDDAEVSGRLDELEKRLKRQRGASQ